MKRISIVLCLFLAFGCGGAGAGKSGTGAVGEPAASTPVAADETTPVAAQDDARSSGDELYGVWENASCGERRYLRRIEFQNGGRFTAVDEVAPCPDGDNCVSSGLLHWQGAWRLVDRVVELTLESVDGTRAPDQTPDEFVVLSDAPFSVGSRSGKLVCPFKKRK